MVSRAELLLPLAPLVARLCWGLLEYRRGTPEREEGVGVPSGGRAHPGTFVLRILKCGSLEEVSGEGLNTVFIGYMLMCPNGTYFPYPIRPGVWLAQMALIGVLLSVSLRTVI